MPSVRPCLEPTCRELVRAPLSRCDRHSKKGWSNTRGMGSGWATLRRRVLTEEPRCRSCGAQAATVDHILARAFGGGDDRANLAPLCAACHRKKTQSEALEGRRRRRMGRRALN
jgi:5-methylcytosine-specific restriction protein A